MGYVHPKVLGAFRNLCGGLCGEAELPEEATLEEVFLLGNAHADRHSGNIAPLRLSYLGGVVSYETTSGRMRLELTEGSLKAECFSPAFEYGDEPYWSALITAQGASQEFAKVWVGADVLHHIPRTWGEVVERETVWLDIHGTWSRWDAVRWAQHDFGLPGGRWYR